MASSYGSSWSQGFMSFLINDGVTKDQSAVMDKGAASVHQSFEQKALSKFILEASRFIVHNAESSVSVSSAINSIDISEDDELIYLASAKGNITCYNHREGKILNDIFLNVGSLNDLIIDENNSRAILCGESEKIRVYRLPICELEFEFEGHTGSVNKIFPDSEKINFFSAGDGTIRAWDLNDFSEKGVLMNHIGRALDLVVSEDDDILISAGEDGIIKVYDLAENLEIKNLIGHTGAVLSLALNTSSEILASGGMDCQILIWNTNEWNLIRTLGTHNGPVQALNLCITKPLLISGGDDFLVKIWDLSKNSVEISMKGHTSAIKSIKISSDMSFFATSSVDTTIHVWKFPDFYDDVLLKSSTNSDFTSVAFVPESKDLVSCGTDKTIKYWDDSGTPIEVLTTQGNGLKVAVSPDKKYIAIGDELGILYIIDWISLELLHKINAHNGLIRDLCFSPDSARLVTGGGDSLVAVWVLPSMRNVHCKGHNQIIWCVCITHDGKRILSGSSDQTIRVWNILLAVQVSYFHAKEPVNVIAVDKDDRLAIIGGMLGDVSVWNIEEKCAESIFSVHSGLVTSIVVLKNNQLFLTAGKDMKINIISLVYRTPISYMTHKQPIFSLALSTDESYLATGESQYISCEENPLSTTDIRVIGPSDDIQPFLTYIKALLADQTPPHNPLMDSFLILPQFMNSLFFYSYFNLREYVTSALINNAPLIKSKSGFYPLYIALLKDYKGIRDEIVLSLCIAGKKNPFLLQIIEKELVKMNKLGFSRLTDIYDALYQEVTRKNFPRFCETTIILPLTHISDHSRIKVSDFFDESELKSQDVSIRFKETYIPFNFSMGSKESIEFLTSISECENTEVFKTQIILDIAQYKWEASKYLMIVQGSIFYVYMLILSLYTMFFMKNTILQVILLIVNVMLLVFEVFQMAVSGKFYFNYVWNYVDWARALMLFCYIFMEWAEIMPDTAGSIFALVTFISWARGISYFRLFKSTRYFINLLINAFSGMSGFMILLIYSIIAFCFLFMVIVKSEGDASFLDDLRISYWLTLGSIDAEEYGPIELGILTFGIMINPVIMMTVLVAKISDEYERIQADSIASDTKELIDMTIEVENLMFWKRETGTKQYFQSVSELENDDDMSWEGRLAALNKMIEKSNIGTQTFYEELIKKLKGRQLLFAKNRSKAEKIEDLCKKIQKKESEKLT